MCCHPNKASSRAGGARRRNRLVHIAWGQGAVLLGMVLAGCETAPPTAPIVPPTPVGSAVPAYQQPNPSLMAASAQAAQNNKALGLPAPPPLPTFTNRPQKASTTSTSTTTKQDDSGSSDGWGVFSLLADGLEGLGDVGSFGGYYGGWGWGGPGWGWDYGPGWGWGPGWGGGWGYPGFW
ncbi:hypothetical protein E3E12_04570 [Formicincola oecophyllae]|uniref:Uncharacterized protein n=1 Tax=Formicincola oecophyllae TaxID=2558361 RepID=A0A4Y6UAV4_9PROT|nr:hypothetical protein [Formicincola oecophyllae]QDH13587.1 hypothetical protein E3E12_04570 [Formicincola oecophyllae]